MPTREETLEAERNAAIAARAFEDAVRRIRDEALEEAARVAYRMGREASAEVERCNSDDVSGHRSYWVGQATMAAKLRAAISALKSKP